MVSRRLLRPVSYTHLDVYKRQVLNRLGIKPEQTIAKHTGEPAPPVEPPANSAPVLDLDGKTEDGSIPYNILMKQLECMK